MTTISEIVLHRLRVPLTVPYKLSFVELRAFDTILVEVHDGDGRVGYGEATLLTGYTQESTARSWDLACRLCRDMAGKSTRDIKRRVGEHDEFLEEVTEVVASFGTNPDEEHVEAFAIRVKEWILTHITTTDRQLVTRGR